jgi:GGDEF domain-containing protein
MGRESSMDKRFSWTFLIVSGAFFVFIVGLTGYRIEDARHRNAAAVRDGVPALASRAAELRDASGGFDAPQFKKDMRGVFDADPRLLVVAIHSPADGMLYLVSRNRAFLREPATITPDWRGTPVYQVTRGYELLVSTTLAGGAGDVTLDAVSVIMGREDLYPVIRDDLFFFLAYLLVCGVLILIVMGIQEPTRTAQGGTARTPMGAPAAAPSPAPTPVLPAAEQRNGPAPWLTPTPEPEPDEALPHPVRALTSPRTGLGWADHLDARLKAELDRASAGDQDLACGRIRIDEPFADAKLPLVHSEIARMLKGAFPLHDLIFESGNDAYTLILPDTELDAAVRQFEQFRAKCAAAPVEGKERTLSVGVSSRGGRLIEARTLLEEAETSLAKASREGGNQVIGFRADPSRFRASLSGSPA